MFGCISWFYVKHALYWAILLLYWAILLLVHTTIQWAILPIQWANSIGHSYDSPMAVLGHPTSFSYDNGRSAIVIGHLELRVQPN